MLIPYVSPLVSVTDVYRLTNFTEEETRALMQQPIQKQYRVTDDAAAAVFAATSGQPRLAQRFGAALYDYQQVTDIPRTILTIEDVKMVTATVQQQSESDFRQIWNETGRNERLVLTAMTRLMYADPLTPVTTNAISEWLIESDFPLDLTTINAAVRALEYDELILNEHQVGHPSEIQPDAGLVTATRRTANRHHKIRRSTPPHRRGLIAAVVVLALVILALAYVVSQQRTPEPTSSATLQPTVTLVTQP